MALKKGTILHKRFWIIEPLKSGGMGAVYKAMDMHFQDRIVAVKEMLQEFSSEETVDLVKRKFREEANILAQLKHDGIPQVIDYFVESNIYYIVMEYIEGENLEKILQQYQTLTGKPIPESLMAEYAIQLCEILEYLHGWTPDPFIHRDVKPGNIILKKLSREVVLVDFGLARRINEESVDTKTLVGTVGYAPIEQFKGRPEPRSDIYGLGATMHHLLSGERPTPLSIEPLETVYPDISEELAKIVNKAISEEPKDRFASAKEMKEALINVLPVLKSRESSSLQKEMKRAEREKEDDEYPTRRFFAPREKKKEKKQYLDENIDEKLRRYETEKLEVTESPWWKNPGIQIIAVLAIIMAFTAMIGSLSRLNKKNEVYQLFERYSQKRIKGIWEHGGVTKYRFLKRDGKTCMYLGRNEGALRQGLIFRNNGKVKLKKIELNLEMANDPKFVIFWGPYGIKFDEWWRENPRKKENEKKPEAWLVHFPDDGIGFDVYPHAEGIKLNEPELSNFALDDKNLNGKYRIDLEYKMLSKDGRVYTFKEIGLPSNLEDKIQRCEFFGITLNVSGHQDFDLWVYDVNLIW